MRKALGAAAALLILSASPGFAQPAATAPAPVADEAGAAALAELVSPPGLLVPMQIQFARQGLAMGLESDPEAKKLFREHPGLIDAIWTAVEPEVRRSIARDEPKFRAKLAALYAARLTPAEIDALRRFYSTPTGQKLVRNLYAAVDPAPVFAEVIKAPDSGVDMNSVNKMQEAAVAKSASAIGREDEPALLALAAAVPQAKMKSIGEETQRLTAEWLNAPDPEFDAKMEQLMVAAVEKHLSGRTGSR